MNLFRLALAVLPIFAYAQDDDDYEHLTPQQIQQQLDESEVLFKKAQEMFNPWYTGPLITPSATMMPPGYGNVQPYLFVTDNHGAYDKHRRSHSVPHSRVNVNVLNIFQFGVTDSMDTILVVGGNGIWQDGHQGGGFADTTLSLGFLVCNQSLYFPKMKFTVQETFPTGRYQNLNSNGLALSGTGGGSWQTQFSWTLGKLFFWSSKHPINTRLSFSYVVAAPVHVKGFNVYGGGYETSARVHPGNVFKADLGIEYSISQPWVFAIDIAYTAQNQTTFSGNPGVTKSGSAAGVGGPYNDSLSLAPAIEYNWNENWGVLGGLWFSVYGKNSANFLSGIISAEWTFPVVKPKK